MIILAQRFFTQQHSEVLVLSPAEDWNAWELGVIVYDPTTQRIEQADPEKARFLGAGDFTTSLRAAVSEVARWSLAEGEATSLSRLLHAVESFLGQTRATLEAKYPTGVPASA